MKAPADSLPELAVTRGGSAVRETGVLNEEYLKAKELSLRIAADLEPPRFYVDKKREVHASREILNRHPMVQKGIRIVRDHGDRLGHGLSHVRKVAVDAGALVIIESGGIAAEPDLERRVVLAHLAGVLHDIKREEPEHAQKGAEEAGRILKAFDVDGTESRAIVQAIRNHEAFKPAQPLDDPSLQVLSDALYDADKFRWGPDNFTETVWMMVALRQVPLSKLMERFVRGMKGIERISKTFRTPTGKKYGPDFIARGLEIGRRLHQALGSPNPKD